MATNLGTSDGLTFNTPNMKPESNDQTDALWGQNLADNLMWLLTREQQVINFSRSGDFDPSPKLTVGTLSFKRIAGHNQIYGTVNADVPADGLIPYVKVDIDGTEVVDIDETDPQTATFNWDLSAKDAAPSIAVGEMVNVVYKILRGNTTSKVTNIKGFQAWSHNSSQSQPSI